MGGPPFLLLFYSPKTAKKEEKKSKSVDKSLYL